MFTDMVSHGVMPSDLPVPRAKFTFVPDFHVCQISMYAMEATLDQLIVRTIHSDDMGL